MTIECTETTINVLGKTYPIRCPASEIPSLQKAAEHLNEKMQALRAQSHTFHLEGAAMILALNLINEVLMLQSQKESMLQKVHQLEATLDLALASQEELPIGVPA